MPAGRPSDFKEEYVEQAERLAECGLTDYEMAKVFDCHISTFYRWQGEYPQLRDALKKGKDVCDERVERSLYHKAVGYTFKSEKIFHDKGSIVRAPFTEHVPPDTGACALWLKNRKRGEWKDRWDVELGEEAIKFIKDPGPTDEEI